VCPSGQLGCNSTNAVSNWPVDPSYTDALSNVRACSDDSTLGAAGVCKSRTAYTSGTANTEWKAMSTVDGTVGTFNYPKTNITAWLCANVYDSSDGMDDGVMNNSSPQAQLFFQNFTSTSQTSGLTINAVTACNGDEGVTDGTPPTNYYDAGYTTGRLAIQFDMVNEPTNRCQSVR
jgi:hypothetical protein